MRGYYTGRLAGERLRRVYEIAPVRVKQYLEAEICHVLARMPRGGLVVELGCGYGRVAFRLAESLKPAPGLKAGSPTLVGPPVFRPVAVIGIDTSADSLILSRLLAPSTGTCQFVLMDAVDLGFKDACFDVVVCVQNGICAFSVDPVKLVREAVRVTRPGGRVFFSSYAEAFWPHRLEWFEQQAAEGLVGQIDYDLSCDGVIACRDGFRAGIMRPADFRRLCCEIEVEPCIGEVDGSSVFCEIQRGSEP